jgi:hypothetical protein
MLKNQDARCSGIFTIGKIEACPKRDRCLRYLHFLRLDRAAGVENYQGIPVVMAVKDCKIFLEAE